MKQSSANTYALYENYDGRYTPHWQDWGVPKVPGCLVNEFGDTYPPPFPLVVRARSAKQACYFANNSITSTSEPDKLGIWWARETSLEPPPLSKDSTTYPTTVAFCRSPTAMAHRSVEDAERALAWIDRYACGGGCSGHHEIVWMTVAEGRRRGFHWYDEP